MLHCVARIQKPLGESPHFVSLNIPFLVKGKRKSVLKAYSDCSEWAINWSIVLAKIDLVALYFRLLWYHSILRVSIDQNHAKTNETFGDKTVQSTQLSLVLVGLHDFQIFADRTAHEWSVEVETYVRSQSFSSESAVKYLHSRRRKIQISPPLGEQDQSNALRNGQQRQSNPHPLPCLPPPPPPPLAPPA